MRTGRNYQVYPVTVLVLMVSVLGVGRMAAQAVTSTTNVSQDSERKALASRIDAPPVIDGILREGVWTDGVEITGFTQREPFTGEVASERTEIKVLFDDGAIYVGVWAFDRDANAIIPGDRIRDTELSNSDAVVLAFDTYDDEQNAFVFATTPSGIEYDGQVSNEGRGGGYFLGGGFGGGRQQSGAGGGFNKNWDGSWNVATSRDESGWYAEFRIPFNTCLLYTSPSPRDATLSGVPGWG